MTDIKYKPIPKYGDLMTLKEFKESCINGFFTDYDGHGYYATDTQMSDIRVPFNGWDNDWTHVVWFNN